MFLRLKYSNEIFSADQVVPSAKLLCKLEKEGYKIKSFGTYDNSDAHFIFDCFDIIPVSVNNTVLFELYFGDDPLESRIAKTYRANEVSRIIKDIKNNVE